MTNHANREVNATMFVTILAWILIVIAGLGSAGTLLQMVAINIMLSFDAGAGAEAFFPLKILPVGFFLFLTFTLICAVALLKRRDWARRAWIALLAVGIGFHALALTLFLLGLFIHLPKSAGNDVQFAQMLKLMAIPMTITALGIAMLFGWLIKRLLSEDVRSQFRGRVAT
jgi:hypothetical protein